MNDEEALEIIHQRGYWRVVMHPAHFQKDRISSVEDCLTMVERSKVSLRGWDYPFFDQAQASLGLDYVSLIEVSDFASEFWRFYQSGQFVHHFALQKVERYGKPGIELPDLIYQLTEIFEFASRLAMRGVFDPGASIQVQLNNISSYLLCSRKGGGPLGRKYVASLNTLEWKRTLFVTDLLAASGDYALEAAESFIKAFHYSLDRRLLAEEQARLLERRLAV